jgi:hypothetical protein
MPDVYIDYDDVGNSEHFLTIHRPVPASEHVPEWFKNLDSTVGEGRTVKSCRGVFDMMTMGYMVVWTFDVIVSKDSDGKLYVRKARDASVGDFQPHPHNQLGLYPNASLSKQQVGVQKLTLPYKILTSKNTSVMMLQPAYRPDLKTEVMPGIIDSDKFYSPLNVLFILKDIPDGREVKIAAGTPLAQIVPFERASWKLKYRKINKKLFTLQDANIMNLDKYYQKSLWTRKSYKKELE